MEEKVDGLVVSQSGIQDQLTQMNAILLSLPQSIAAALAGPTGDKNTDEIVVEPEQEIPHQR